MVSPRFKNLPKEKREKIMEIAGREFADHGYDGASVSHILEQAGISKGAAYYYFENKADLFRAVVKHHIDKLMESVSFTQFISEFSWAGMRRMMQQSSETVADTHRVVHLLQHAWEVSKETRDNEHIAKQFSRVDEWIRILITKGQESGAIRSDLPHDLLVQLYVGFHEAVSRWWIPNRGDLDWAGEKEIGMKLVEILQRLLQPPGKTNKRSVSTVANPIENCETDH